MENRRVIHASDFLSRVFAVDSHKLILELGLLGSQTTLHVFTVVMLEVAALDGRQVVGVNLLESLFVGDSLHRGVPVVLVDFLVDSCLNLFCHLPSDGFMGDGWGHALMDGGCAFAGVGPVSKLFVVV